MVYDVTNEFFFAVAGAGIDEGASRVNDGTNVVGSDVAAAVVIAAGPKGISVREMLTALRPALVVGAVRSGICAPDSLTVIEPREALFLRFLESESSNSTEAPWFIPPSDPWSVEPWPRPPLSPRRLPSRPLPPAGLWSVELRLLPFSYDKLPNYRGAYSKAQGEVWRLLIDLPGFYQNGL
jgi:hypothetical protein